MAWGRLFGDRYKAVLVEGADSYRYRTLADYIHLNPVRARLVVPKKGQSVLDYPWSSVAGGWAMPPGKRPQWLAAEEGLIRFDLPDTVAGRRRMAERLDRRAVEEENFSKRPGMREPVRHFVKFCTLVPFPRPHFHSASMQSRL
jgi:hypothetical protein